MGTRTIRGRTALDRAGVAALTGRSDKTIEYWYQHRAETGFPEAIETDTDGRQWYPQSEVKRFWKQHQADIQNRLPIVDRTGDPDELVTAPEAAKVLGLANRNSLHKHLLDNPDDIEDLPSGRVRKRWRRSTLWAFADGRQADRGGGRPNAGGAVKVLRYTDDARLNAAIELVKNATATGRTTTGLGAQLAHDLGIQERTAQRLINAAKKALTDAK